MTFKELNIKEKIAYLYDYYRYYFYVFIFLLFVFIYFILPIFDTIKSNTVLSIAIIDCNITKRMNTTELEKDLLLELKSTNENDKVIIDPSRTTIETDSNSVSTTVAFSIASGNDIIVCDEKSYLKYKELDAFQSWEVYLKDDFDTYSKYIDDDKLLLGKSEKWTKYGYTSYSPVYAVILSSPTNPENINAFVTLLFD